MRLHNTQIAALVLIVLLAAMFLLVGTVALVPAQATDREDCQPVTDVALTHNPTQPYPQESVLFESEILTGSVPLTYTWDFGDGTQPITGTAASSPVTVNHSYSTTGAYTVTFATWNTCTVTPLATTTHVTVTARPCLTLTGLALTYTPTQAYAHAEVIFAGEVVTGSPPVTYTWDFGDGTVPLTGTAAGPVFTTGHTYTTTGTYTPTLAAWNRCTIMPAERSITLTVAPCEPPSDLALSYWPAATQARQVVTFTATMTGSTPPRTFDWAFGDGHTASGAVVTHAYTAPLTYTVILTGATPCGSRTTTATLSVAPSISYVFLPLIYRVYQEEDPPPESHLGYGANIASADHVVDMASMGFDWAKGWVTWRDAGAGPAYNWINVDNQMTQFLSQVEHVLLRLHHPTPPGIGDPPTSAADLAAFEDFTRALAAHVSTTWRDQGLETIAYEIWNEPNLDYEWGGPPSAAQYTALLQAGYRGIKAGDPDALVVTGALATTGGTAAELDWAKAFYGTDQVTPDLTFLRGMYNHGAKGYFDALGSHPYGGSYPPDTPPDQVVIPVYFRRAEEQHQVMLDNGDDSPIWATEFGWVVQTSCHLGEHEWMEVSEAQQAEYLAAAYAYADENWPWMGPMFLFNQDFGTVSWYAICDPMRWYSITYRQDPYDPGNSPILSRPAVDALRDMPKNSAW